ncbi:MAG: hypothetical protein AAFO91_07480 [Bacteroidota bacterium]
MLNFRKYLKPNRKFQTSLQTLTRRNFSTEVLSDIVYNYKTAQRKQKSNNLRLHIDKSTLHKVSSKEIQHFLVADLGYDLRLLEFMEFPFHSTPESQDSYTNCLRNSYLRVRLPLSEQPELQTKLKRFNDNSIRTGALLELMDFVCGRICYRHIDFQNQGKGTDEVD